LNSFRANEKDKPKRGELLAWASYDVANSVYGTVVATAVYNAYFVEEIAGHSAGFSHGAAAALLTASIFVSSLINVFTAPLIGTISDARAAKKKLLFCSTFLCIACVGALAFIGPGSVWLAALVLTLSNVAFGTGESLIAAFLPELAESESMGRISALGWAAGYVGGLISLSIVLAYISWAQKQGLVATQYVPGTMLFCAVYFALASLPTFIWVRERAKKDPEAEGKDYMRVGLERLANTFSKARHYRDLFSFLLALFTYTCGTATVFHLASVYAQQVFQFTTRDTVAMILSVNVMGVIGSLVFGFVQDRIGSIKTLVITLLVWVLAVFLAFLVQERQHFWLVANLVGLAMGASGSAGRALVARFAPQGRSGEFLGLWNVAVKLATAVGPMTFGLISYITASNFRVALLSTEVFLVVGTIMLFRVNEERGTLASHSEVKSEAS
jgi:UMF1 family MFS transporter